MTHTTRLAIAASSLLLAGHLLAQESGVSRPEDLHDNITTTAVPTTPARTSVVTTETTTVVTAQPAPAAELHTRVYAPAPYPAEASPTSFTSTVPLVISPEPDAADAGIVTRIPSSPFQLPEGTLLKVTLNETLSTGVTKAGSAFYAHVANDVLKDGKVVLPAGAVLAGRVTEVRGGHRIGGAAAIHLRPYSVTLPDGTIYDIEGQVIDSDLYRSAHVTSEGTITHTDHAGATIGAIGFASGTSAVAGAMLAGPAGALIGAGVGAGLGTFVWLRQDHQQVLPEGTSIVFSLTAPMDIRPAAMRAAQHAALVPDKIATYDGVSTLASR